MHRRVLLRTSLAAVFAAAVLSAAAAAQGLKLARTPKKGDMVTYRFEVKGDVAEVPFSVTGRTKREVTEVKDSGDFVTTETNEETKVVVMGMELPSPPVLPLAITRARGNRLLDYKTEQQADFIALEVQRLLSALGEPLMPGKDVSGGDTWETEIENPVVAAKKVKVKTRFAGTEKLGEAEVWKVTQSAAADLTEGQLSFDATYWLDPSNGQILKQEAMVKNVPSQFGASSWTEIQERVKP